MKDRIKIDIHNGVADVRLVRSEKMNALDSKMFEAIAEAGAALADDKSVRAVVLSGEGKAFCAGLDMSNFAAMAGSSAKESMGEEKSVSKKLTTRTHGIANSPQHAAWVWRELPVPVIAAVHGVALGGGFQVCLGADIRYAAPGTRMSIMEIKWGLVPDMAGMALMRTLARDDVIRELSYTGRIFTAEEAVNFGFVTQVVEDPRAHALEVAQVIAGKNPDAIQADKRMFNANHDLSIEEVLLMESVEQDSVIGTANQIEAVMAEMEKRPAIFT
jgi:enoyl-CoA hydratase/carnithine racemase